MNTFSNTDFNKPSEIIRNKLHENGGTVNIPLFNGKPCNIVILNDNCSFSSDKLNDYKIKFEFRVFDDIVNLLKESPNGRARKGNGRGKEDKVGYGKCTPDTVLGAIAIRYMKKSMGESTYDPVFVMAAILDWADIAKNERGYIRLLPAWNTGK